MESLADQSYPPYAFEVLVCDDGSVPPLAERVPVKDCPFSVRFLRDENQGPATARNRGAREARGTILAFTDDDCMPAPTWLEAIAQTLADPAQVAVHGPTRSSVPPIEPFIHSIHISREHGVATANFAVRKEAFWHVGGFDETFTVPYFEDEDLSRRLQSAYGPPAWSEEVRVEHPPRTAKLGSMWRGAKFYYFLPYMQRKYAGYWAEAMPAVRKRALIKGALVLVGLLPLVGLPWSLAIAWAGIFAWQARRLKKALDLAVIYHVPIPITSQLGFLGLEWAVDFVRWSAYFQGRNLQTKPAPPHELEGLEF